MKSTSSALNGFLNYGIPDAGSVASVVSSSAGQKRAIFSHLTTSEGFFTGLALLNSGQLAANIRILVMTPSGDVLGSFTSVLRPGQRLSRLIDQLIPETTDRNGGFIWVKSDLPLHFTSIFGSSSVLANIPPQAAPESYRPDTGLTSVEVTPSLAVAQPNQTTQFEIAGVGETVTWSVNDQIGGSTEAGTISQAGLYQAPATIPDPRVITVTGESAGQTGGASVDILSKESLFSSTNVVQSVAYLGSLEKLYTAELAILSTAEPGTRPALASPAQESANSEIFEFGPGGIKIRLARFKSEAIVKLIPFRAANGKEFLLLASRTNGRIYRLDPENGSNQLVVSNLNEPTALVIDFLTGDLLVAQKDQIIIIPRLELEAGLTAALRIFPPGDRPLTADLFPTDAADGITTDRCTGDVYISKRENGEILRYDRSTGQLETFVSGLRQPTQLLSLYRKGVPCPDSFQFIVIEQENDRTLLFRGVSGARSNWIEVKDGTDIAFLPPGSSFSRGEAILLAEAQGNGSAQQGGGVVNVVEADGIYEPEPDNEPDPQQQADPLEITSESPLADGEDNMAYSTTLSAQGGTRPFSWSLVSGNLPRGLSLDSDSGRISGTPSRSGTSSFTVKVTDSLSDTSSKTFTLKIDEDPDPLRITTGSSLPGGTSADSYSTTLKAAGGKPSYHWSVQSGSLPDGLSLSSSGVLSGTPVGTGTFNFRGRVTDRDGDSETKSFSLNISLGGQ